MRRTGAGMSRDDAAAVPFFERAAKLGDARAQNDLGYAYDFGIGVAIDHSQAEHWYSEAARSGNLLAMNNLAYNWSLAERNLSAALGAGVTPESVDRAAIDRVADWLKSPRPPPSPYRTDAAAVAPGRTVPSRRWRIC